ncbi:MAG: hypothetical protein ABIR61_11870 [Casimicrobiaceae bacterium]
MQQRRNWLLAVALAGIAGSAWAGTADPGVKERQAHEKARINHGVASGELTNKEARRLRAEQRGIKAEEHAMKADGTLTKAERKKLHRDLNAASRDIHRQKHDGQTR